MRRIGKRSWIGLGVLLALGASVLAVTSSALSASSQTAASDCKTLNLLTWEGYADPSFVKPFEKKYGTKIKATYVGADADLISKLVAGGTKQYQVVNVGSATRARQSAAGVIQPIELNRLTNFKQIFPFLKPAYVLNGKVWGVAQDWGVNPFVYNKTVFKTPPKSYNVMWDPKLKNRLALWDSDQLIFIGATVMGYDKFPPNKPGGIFDLTDKQLAALKAKMLTLKPQVRAMWSTGGDLIQLMAQNEVDGAPGWNYIYQQLQAKKFPVGQVSFADNGANGWIDGLGITTGTKGACYDMAYNWINYMTGAVAQATMAKATGYGAANPNAKKLMSAALIKSTLLDNPAKLIKGSIIKVDPKRPDVYLRVAKEITNGLK